MNYLFWNTNKNININNILFNLIEEYNCDIIALAEYMDSEDNLLALLNKSNKKYYSITKIGCNRITIITKCHYGLVRDFKECSYYTIKLFPHEKFKEHLISFVHFPSKLHFDEDGYIDLAIDLKNDLEEAEIEINKKNSIIIGDFNMNPFENAMVSAACFSSVSCKNIARNNSRKVRSKNYNLFYNPMWNMFGDFNSPPGGYYYNTSKHISYFWNLFDQVLIRPDLCNYFKKENLKIITEIKEKKLINKNGKPDKAISDHLPIIFSIG